MSTYHSIVDEPEYDVAFEMSGRDVRLCLEADRVGVDTVHLSPEAADELAHALTAAAAQCRRRRAIHQEQRP